ncbi:hypothetical protein [Xanthomonas medicagonis]|uniref:hypothetical protein n=1 Tax=Xanthomonas medicagonis TaxID=3160841 RepID=UPI0035146E7A
MNLKIRLRLALFMVSSCAGATDAHPATAYPAVLLGTWNLGPQSCTLPVSPDADSPIRLEAVRLVGYEHQESLVSIKRVSMDPLAWAVTTTSDNAPGIRTVDLYIVKGDYLTISDGEATRQYRRCK